MGLTQRIAAMSSSGPSPRERRVYSQLVLVKGFIRGELLLAGLLLFDTCSIFWLVLNKLIKLFYRKLVVMEIFFFE